MTSALGKKFPIDEKLYKAMLEFKIYYSTDNQCRDDQFKCERDNICILKQWVCDRENDCSDGSDERDEICRKFSFENLKKNVSTFLVNFKLVDI